MYRIAGRSLASRKSQFNDEEQEGGNRTYKLLAFDNALEIASILIVPMSPRASTSSMCFVMSCREMNSCSSIIKTARYT